MGVGRHGWRGGDGRLPRLHHLSGTLSGIDSGAWTESLRASAGNTNGSFPRLWISWDVS